MRFLQTYRPLVKIGCLLLELILLAHLMLSANDSSALIILFLAVGAMGIVFGFCFGWRQLVLHACLIFMCFAFQCWREQPLSGLQFAKPAVYRGQIVRTDFRAEGKMDLIVDLDERLSPLQQNLTGRIRINVAERCFINNGTAIQMTGRIYQPKSFDNTGVYNHRLNMRIRNIWGSMYLVNCDDIHILHQGEASLIERMRRRILDDLLVQMDLNESQTFSRAVFAALLLGTATLDEDVIQSAQLAGISHLFAISGSHFAVMSLIVFAVVSFVMSFVPRIFLKFPRQKIAAVMTIGFVLLFLILAEYRTSILRSGCMILVYLTARLCHRRGIDVYIVLCSSVVLLVFNPLQIFEVSFQLTYLCVLYLILVYPLCEQICQRCLPSSFQNPILKLLTTMTLLSMTIQIFLLPYTIYRFDAVSLGGFVNNLWAVPLFEFIVTPFSFAYLFVALLSLPMESYLLNLWEIFWVHFSAFLERVNEVVGFNITIFAPTSETLLVIYFGVFVMLYFKSRKGLVLCGVVAVLLVFYTGYQQRYAYDARITQFDVDQGDATLMQTRDQNILIDTGGHAYFDIGASVLLPALKHLWVDRLDLVILTHPDLDHYQGLSGLLGHVSIGEVWIAPVHSEQSSYQELLQRIAELQIPIRIVSQGESKMISEEAQLKIISPAVTSHSQDNKNDNSLVVLFQNKHVQFLVTGDASKSVEQNWFDEFSPARINILKVGHHGSNTSTGILLLHRFKPQFALIGVGENSRFGHPNRSVLQRLESVGARVLRTDVHGMIQLQIKNNHVGVETFYRRGDPRGRP